MNHYIVFSARLQYNESNELRFSIKLDSLEKCKEVCKSRRINPFYAVIKENGKIVHNEHLEFYTTTN